MNTWNSKAHKPSFTYVTAYCANDRYSTRTSRPRFSSFRNSLTHLLKNKNNYQSIHHMFCHEKAQWTQLLFHQKCSLQGNNGGRRRLHHTKEKLFNMATGKQTNKKNSISTWRKGSKRYTCASFAFYCLGDLRWPVGNVLKKELAKCTFSTTTDPQPACQRSQDCTRNAAGWERDDISTETQAWFQIHIQVLLGTWSHRKHWTSQWETSV